ncbi:Hypothetical predicted protein [Lecanosticta acicola]|uniref:Uncharacterized protein n=1 Tax=Lecanosticta acicola TaxID=111012 RepID=A0AAI8YTY4_9PEZI|nr:Hypothetical predicted protein [Lecanosticta acicola]
MAIKRILAEPGDLSPLFIVPTSARTNYRIDSGYVDHNTWGLSARGKLHAYTIIREGIHGLKSVVISAEEITIFRYVRRFD